MNNQIGTFLFKSLPNDLDILKSQYSHSQSNFALSEDIKTNKKQLIQINAYNSGKINNKIDTLILPNLSKKLIDYSEKNISLLVPIDKTKRCSSLYLNRKIKAQPTKNKNSLEQTYSISKQGSRFSFNNKSNQNEFKNQNSFFEQIKLKNLKEKCFDKQPLIQHSSGSSSRHSPTSSTSSSDIDSFISNKVMTQISTCSDTSNKTIETLIKFDEFGSSDFSSCNSSLIKEETSLNESMDRKFILDTENNFNKFQISKITADNKKQNQHVSFSNVTHLANTTILPIPQSLEQQHSFSFKNKAFYSIKKTFNRSNNQIKTQMQAHTASLALPLHKNMSVRFEMPSLIEQNELVSNNISNINSSNNSNIDNLSKINILINECSDEDNNKNLEMMKFNDSSSQTVNVASIPSAITLATSMTNIALNNQIDTTTSPQNILEYLINPKSNLINTKMAIANIAAVAANSENNNNCNSNNIINASSSASCTNTSSAGYSSTNQSNSNNENFLQALFLDLVPTQGLSSQFDLSSTASNDHIDLSIIYQNQPNTDCLITNTNNSNNNNNNNNSNVLNLLQINNGAGSGSGSFNIGHKASYEFNSAFNGSFTSTSKKQINDQIMRTCMGYLDFINKKHNRERQLQTIRNKISGFVLLTIVFMMVVGLSMIMTFSLTKSLTKIIKTKQINKSYNQSNHSYHVVIGNSKNVDKAVHSGSSFSTSNNSLNKKITDDLKILNEKIDSIFLSPTFLKISEMLLTSKDSLNSTASLEINNHDTNTFLANKSETNTDDYSGSINEAEKIINGNQAPFNEIINLKKMEGLIKYEIKIFISLLSGKISTSNILIMNRSQIEKRLNQIELELFYLIMNLFSLNELDDHSSLRYFKYVDELNA